MRPIKTGKKLFVRYKCFFDHSLINQSVASLPIHKIIMSMFQRTSVQDVAETHVKSSKVNVTLYLFGMNK